MHVCMRLALSRSLHLLLVLSFSVRTIFITKVQIHAIRFKISRFYMLQTLMYSIVWHSTDVYIKCIDFRKAQALKHYFSMAHHEITHKPYSWYKYIYYTIVYYINAHSWLLRIKVFRVSNFTHLYTLDFPVQFSIFFSSFLLLCEQDQNGLSTSTKR